MKREEILGMSLTANGKVVNSHASCVLVIAMIQYSTNDLVKFSSDHKQNLKLK